MVKPEDITDSAMMLAEAVNDEIFRIAHDEVHVLGHTERKAAIARAIMAAEKRGEEREREACAAFVEGKGGVIPAAEVFAPLVSRNNQPCMSGDARDRLHSHTRRNFDDAVASLATAIRNRGAEQ